MTASGVAPVASSASCGRRLFNKQRLAVRANKNEAGSQIIEFGLVLLPLLAFLFLIMNIAWMCFSQASLQHAVQMGVRAAVTGAVPSSYSGQDSYIKSIVQKNAMGFLSGWTGLSKITVTYYLPTNLSQAVTGVGSNVGGNVIQVSVTNVSVGSLGPIMSPAWASLALNAVASDVMESSPDGIPPTR